ncbi:hypothetical protein LINPERHAP2_LOCUS12320 [Linum perenne]
MGNFEWVCVKVDLSKPLLSIPPTKESPTN